MGKLARDNRNGDITRIQIARRDLSLSDDDYRTILAAQGNGATSSKDLDHEGRARVLAYFQTLGWKPKPATRRTPRPTPPADKLQLVRRIRAQLISLDRKPDTYADGIARQMFGEHVQYFEWCDHEQLHKITSALGVEQRRKGAPTRRT